MAVKTWAQKKASNLKKSIKYGSKGKD